MGITMTSVDNKTTFRYENAQQLNEISMKYNITVDALKKQADRNNDALQGTNADLAVGDVLILSPETAKTIHDIEKNNTNPQQPAAANTEEKDQTDREIAVKVATCGAVGLMGAAAGAKAGAAIGTAAGPWGIAIGAIVGCAIGYFLGDVACEGW